MRGRIVDASGLPLPGVTITLLPQPGGPPITAVTDASGSYTIDAPAGRYALRAELSGFRPEVRREVSSADPPTEIDLTLQVAGLQTQVTVVAQPHPLVGQAGADQPEIVTRKLFDAAMLWNNQYSDALPLLPNVVRAPDGQISVAGARTEQGALLLNGFDESDPVTGEPSAMAPLESIGSMQVYSGFYPADLGRAAGGVTSIDTRPGGETWQYSAAGFMPRMRFGPGLVDGVDSWEPSVGLRGPVVRGRAWFAESLDYQYNHNQFDTAAGSQQNLFTSISSLSQVDLAVSPGHHLGVSLLADPQETDFAGITQFTPAAATPTLHLGGWSATAVDRLTFGSATTIESRLAVSRVGDSTTPNGTGPYIVGHDVTTGSYFDTQTESAHRLEVGATVGRLVATHLGDHLFKAGLTLEAMSADGKDESTPVAFLRGDGSVSETIAFPGAAALSASERQATFFVEDRWTPVRPITLDLGVRDDRSDAATAGVVAPRIGATIALPGNRATISAGYGIFADKLTLQTLTFAQLPPRVVQLYTADGTPEGPARLYRNALAGPLRMPSATGWSLEFDRDFARGWLARVKYEDRRGSGEPIVSPEIVSATQGLLALSSGGASHAWSLETTVGYRAAGGSGDEVYASYVRSASTGNLNDLNSIDGLFKTVLVLPDALGPLAADAPNRLLTWGLLQLPFRLTLAPFLELRSGFPYTAINDDWTIAGSRNGLRYPAFASLNLAAYRVVRLSRLPAARIGFQVFNLVSANNARDIQTDVMSPAYQTLYNPAPREFDGYFELLWGRR